MPTSRSRPHDPGLTRPAPTSSGGSRQRRRSCGAPPGRPPVSTPTRRASAGSRPPTPPVPPPAPAPPRPTTSCAASPPGATPRRGGRRAPPRTWPSRRSPRRAGRGPRRSPRTRSSAEPCREPGQVGPRAAVALREVQSYGVEELSHRNQSVEHPVASGAPLRPTLGVRRRGRTAPAAVEQRVDLAGQAVAVRAEPFGGRVHVGDRGAESGVGGAEVHETQHPRADGPGTLPFDDLWITRAEPSGQGVDLVVPTDARSQQPQVVVAVAEQVVERSQTAGVGADAVLRCHA